MRSRHGYGSHYVLRFFTMIVIPRSCLFRFFPAVLFLHYPIRQVDKGKVFGFLQNHILKFTKIQV